MEKLKLLKLKALKIGTELFCHDEDYSKIKGIIIAGTDNIINDL